MAAKFSTPAMAVAAALIGSGAVAAAPPGPPPTVRAVLDCRGIADSAARLACYDAAVAAMDKAETSGDLVTIDREQRRAARRQAFGLPLPSLAFLERGEKAEEVNRLQATVASAHQGPYGRWVVTLDDGAIWAQVDDNEIFRPPHPGSKVDIRKGLLGSFFMKIDGQQAVRAKRAM